jgi:hypothetical protein
MSRSRPLERGLGVSKPIGADSHPPGIRWQSSGWNRLSPLQNGQARAGDRPAVKFSCGVCLVQREDERPRLQIAELARKAPRVRLADGHIERDQGVVKPSVVKEPVEERNSEPYEIVKELD